MVDEGSGSQPKLSTILTRTVHNGKVIFSQDQQLTFLFFAKFRNAPHQMLDVIMFAPRKTPEFVTYIN
jgi:hypothetical protein